MRVTVCVASVVIAATINVHAQQEPAAAPQRSAAELFAIAIEAQQQVDAIDAERDAALQHRPTAQRYLQRIVRELEAAAPEAQALQQLADRIDSLRRQLQGMKDNPHVDPAMTERIEVELAWHQRMHDAQQKTDAAARAAARDQAKRELDELSQQIETIDKPFKQRLKQIDERVQPHAPAFKDVIAAHLKNVQGATACEVTAVSAHMRSAFVSCRWVDADGKQIAWAHLRVRDRSQVPDDAKQNLLDGKYPIQTEADFHLWIWAGNVLVTFVPTDSRLRMQEVLRQRIGEFVDLPGLAVIEPAADAGAAGQTAPGAPTQ